MADQILIGNFPKGLTLDRLPFVIDNDAFPYLYNFYVWRGRARRKRGTIQLGRLQRQVQIGVASWQLASFNLVGGAGNFISQYSLGSSSSIVPKSISIVVGGQTYTDPNANGTLTGSGGGTGTINYATGAFTITGGGGGAVTASASASFSYYPGLPVMGLEDCLVPPSSSPYPSLLAFDMKYAYQVNQTSSATNFYTVSYYKSTNNPVVWSGQDYQQFWTTNYQGAFWATNGKAGFQFETIATITVGNPTTITTATPHGLITNDYVWFNEITGADANLLNGLAFQITKTGATTFTVAVNTTAKVINNSGIFQTLTATSQSGDGIRWYDGDMTSGTGIPTSTTTGWVNFAPPLTATTTSIDNSPTKLWYLVGAQAIVPFKDRLLFFAPYIQASTGAAIQLQDTVIWSWNGTPYYSIAPTNESTDVTAYYVDQAGKGGYLSAGIQQPIVTINNNEDVLLVGFSGRQTRFVYTSNDLNPFLFYSINSELGSSATFSGITLDRGGLTIGTYGIAITSQTGSARIDLQIPDTIFGIQAANNGVQRVCAVRDFYREWIYFTYPIASTWDESTSSGIKFPTQTLLYNYRDDTWAILYENFTTYGTYRQSMGFTWATNPFSTWEVWGEPWNSGYTQAKFPSIVGGNPQGYVLIKGQGTAEAQSGTIKAIASSAGNTQITSTDHCVQVGDYLYITSVLGLLSSTITAISQATQAVITTVNTFAVGNYVTISGVVGMTELNGNTYKIVNATGTSITIDVDSTNFTAYSSGGTVTSAINNIIGRVLSITDSNTFVIDIPVPTFTTVYLGLGTFARLSQPSLQTKQFNPYWQPGKQVRISQQKYLLDRTPDSQATVSIYLSQNPDDPWTAGPIVPEDNSENNSLVYSQILYTCPESTNIGLTAANTNLQMPTAGSQFQIWHRMNSSLIGDSFQIGISLSDAQMRNLTYATSELTVHAMQFNISEGPLLA